MDSKAIAVVVVFAALTIVLNLSPFKIPAPYAPFLYYQIWEIPIVAAFLIFGLRAGTAISVINTIVLLGVFPGASPTGPFYNLAAILSMLFGIYLMKRFFSSSLRQKQDIIKPTSFTTIGVLFRVAFMTLVNWVFLPFPPPIGFSMPADVAIAWLPLIGVFNATLALYTIPIGYILARIISSSLKTNLGNKQS